MNMDVVRRRFSEWEESRWFTPLCGLLSVLLLMPPIWSFHLFISASDSLFNFWMARFYANSMAQGIWLPEVLNVSNGVLNPLPAFYASMLHLPAGLLTPVLGMPGAYWALMLAVSWVQYAMTAYALGLAARSRLLGNLAAAMMLFSSYAFNNLFVRGALAEFVACALAVTGVCALLALCLQPERRRELLLLAAAAFALVGNIHPATAMYCALFFWPLGLWSVVEIFRPGLFRRAVLPASLAAAPEPASCSGPASRWGLWGLFVLTATAVLLSVAHFVHIVLANPDVFITMYDMPMHLEPNDNLLLRFFPLPVAFALFGPTMEGMGTFALMIFQINVPLLVLAGYGLYRAVRGTETTARTARFFWVVGVAACCLVLAVVVTLVSVKTSLFPLLYAVVKKGQFGYRLITYVNLFLLLGVFFLFCLLQDTTRDGVRRLAGWMLGLAFLGLLAFNVQAAVGFTWRLGVLDAQFGRATWTQPYTVRDTSSLTPGLFYGFADYMTFGHYAPEAQPLAAREVALSPQTARVLRSDAQTVEAGQLLRFPVAPFRWNRLIREDAATGERVIIPNTVLTYTLSVEETQDVALYYRADRAGTFVFSAEFSPPRTWQRLRVLFAVSLSFLLLGAAWGGLRLLRQRQ